MNKTLKKQKNQPESPATVELLTAPQPQSAPEGQPAGKQRAARRRSATPREALVAKPGGGVETVPGKSKKSKLVRDSFSMPAGEYAMIEQIKQRFLVQGVHVKKSEVLRAGLLALAAMSEAEQWACLNQVERVKTGRPAVEA